MAHITSVIDIILVRLQEKATALQVCFFVDVCHSLHVFSLQ